MKKRIFLKQAVYTFLLAVLWTTMVPQSARAVPGFTLTGGVIYNGGYEQSYIDFWRNLVIEFSDDGSGILTGFGEGSATSYNSSPNCTDTTWGQVNGTYDPNTGLLRGNYTLNHLRVFHLEKTSSDTDHYEISIIHQGSYKVQLHPGDTSVRVDFMGTKTQQVTGEYPPGWTENGEEINFTVDSIINVTFNIEGEIVVNAPATPARAELPDSGARFSDLSGMVEVLLPTGIDENGQYTYDEEAWSFAKLDMVLPYGTHIRTQDRSSVMLSFADMTVFEQKAETEIVLSPPDPKKSHFQLIYGSLMTNVKKVLKEGTMEIEMSQAVCGIKGTVLVLEDDGATSTLKVLEGSVEFTSRVTGETQMVNTGQMITADANGLGDLQTFDATTERLNWSSLQTEPEAQATTAPLEKSVQLILIVCSIGLVGLILLVILGVFVVRMLKKPR